jgi:hypothetical protein
MFSQKSDTPLAVAKSHQIFAEQADANRGAVALRDFFRQQRGNPVVPHELSQRLSRPYLSEQFIFVSRQHDSSSYFSANGGTIPRARCRSTLLYHSARDLQLEFGAYCFCG